VRALMTLECCTRWWNSLELHLKGLSSVWSVGRKASDMRVAYETETLLCEVSGRERACLRGEQTIEMAHAASTSVANSHKRQLEITNTANINIECQTLADSCPHIK
jgi:hypothetical protein